MLKFVMITCFLPSIRLFTKVLVIRTFKISQYAILDGTERSLNQTLEELSRFSKIAGLKSLSLLRQGILEPGLYGDLVYTLKKIVGSNNFSAQFIRIIFHYKKIGCILMYWMVVNPMLWLLSGPSEFTCWISFAPVFSFI